MSDDLNTELRFGADTTGAEAGVNRVKRSLKDLGDSANKASKDAGDSLGRVGAGGDKAAKDVARATKTMQSSLQRVIASFEGGEKGSRQFYESLARQRNIDVNTLKPLLDQLDAVKTKSQAAAQASVQVGNSFTGLSAAAGLAARAVAAIGIGASVGEFIKMADASTNVASRLGLVTSSAAELASVQQRLFGIAQASRVSFVDLVGTYAQVARSTKDLGVSQTALLGVIQTISQAVTISGGSAASAQAALTQLSQGFASGALRGEELNSILEQTPRLAQALADGLGVGVGKLRELGQAGELTSEKVLGALEKSAASVAAEFGKMAVTVEQASTNAANSALKLVGVLDKITGASSATAGGISRLSAGMDGLAINIERLSGSKGLSDFFFLAFNNERSLNGELEITQKELAGLEARLAKAPSNIYTRSAVAEMREYVKELKEAQARLAALSGQSGPTDPRDQSGFTGRGTSYANEAARQAKLRDDANAFRLNQSGVPASYLKDMAELIRLNQAGVIVGKEYTDALKAQQDVLLKKTGAVKGSAAAANAEQNAYESLISSIRAKIEADNLELAGGAALTESQRIRIKLDQDLAAGRVKLSAQNERAVRLALEELSASEASALAAKALSKSYAEAAAERIKTIQSMERAADSLQSQNDALRDEIELIGLSTEQQTLVLQQRNDVIILTKEATLAELERQSAITGTQTRVEIALASEIEALKERNSLLGAKGIKESAKQAEEEWKRSVEKYEDIFRQGFADMLNNGKDGWKSFTKSLATTFKTTVADQIYKMFAQKFVVNIVGNLMGVTGALGGGQSGGGGIAGGIQTASNLNSLYGAGSQALFGGAAGASAASLGYANVVGMAGGDAIGALATANGMWAGVATGAQAAAQAAIAANTALAAGEGVALAAGTNAAAAGAGAAGAGGMSGALAAIPGWGWALAGVAALGMLAKKFDDSGTPHIGAGAIYSEAGGLQEGAGIYNRGTFGMGATGEYAQGTQAGVSAIATGLAQTFDGLAKAFGKTAGYEIATAFADDSSKDGAWGSFRISQGGQDLLNWENDRQSKWAPREFANGEEGYKQYMAEIAKGARTALVTAIGDVSWAKDMLTAIGESASMEQLSATVQQIAAIKTQFVQLGKAMEMFDGISSGMESALLSAAGSIDALTASASGYYDAVYTEQEKIARARTQLETALAGYGQSLPATREQYRALVEQQMAAGESGAEFAVVLMGLAGTFAQVADDIDAQFAEIGKSAAEVFEKLLADIGRVRGDVAGTRADMLASAQGMTPAQMAAAIGAAMVYAPSTAGVVGAQNSVASAASQLAVSQAASSAAQAVAKGNYGALQASASGRDGALSMKSELEKSESALVEWINSLWDGGANSGYRYSKRKAWSDEAEAQLAQVREQLAELTPVIGAYNAAVSEQQAAYDAAQGSANGYAQQLAAAHAAMAAAQRAEVQARVDYAAQISQFVTAAGGSVSKLSGLREEVVRYYEAQEQAVQSMIATAENLRAVVDGIRMGQLDSAQTASQLGSRYASDYSMALATTGTTRAGYADSMASTLPTLAEAIKAEASTASDWRVQTGKLLAQATGVAGMLEADASGTDYQTTSLGLLDSIDSALAQLEGSTKSAEQVIAQAITDGTASQLTGLRAIVAALRGESVPAFATGGSFGGGLRLVGENGPELEVTGPSRIYSASQTAAMLSGGGNANAELVAELRALRADNQAQAAAMVNMQRELNKLMLRWDSQGMPEERIV